jgi:hypothetical protein
VKSAHRLNVRFFVLRKTKKWLTQSRQGAKKGRNSCLCVLAALREADLLLRHHLLQLESVAFKGVLR